MAFELPTLPFPIDSRGTPYIASPDANGKYAVAAGQWFKNVSNLWVPVSAADPLPSTDIETQSRIGAKADAAVTDPTLSASEIALLKGLLKQLQGSGNGAVPVTLTGSNVAEPGVFTTQAKRDLQYKAYEEIIDTIGLDSLLAFVPMHETSGTTFSSIMNNEVVFDAVGPTLGQGESPLGTKMPYFDGVNDYAIQQAKTKNETGNTDLSLNGTTLKSAQKLILGFTCTVSCIELNLKLVGSLPSAQLVVKICADNSGVPGGVLYTSEAVNCAEIGSDYTRIGFAFGTLANQIDYSFNWIVLEYSTATGVDVNNYVVWQYDSAGTYGQPRAFYDGTAWTATSGQNHVFWVYGDELVTRQDFTILMGASIDLYAGAPRTLFNPMIGLNTDNSGYTTLKMNWYDNDVFFARNIGAGIADARVKKWLVTNTYYVYGYSFSYSASTDKKIAYINGTVVQKANGTVNTGPALGRTPFIIGATKSNIAPYSLKWFLNGLGGPLIVASRVLTTSEVAKISNRLLGLKKRVV